MPVFSPDRLRAFVQTSLESAGLSTEEALICADAAVFADARGTDTHGVIYILPKTLQSLRQGRTTPGTQPVVRHDAGATALMVGTGVAGPVLGQRAMELAIRKATAQGVGAVATRNGNPLGLLGYYPALALSAGMVGVAMANTSPAVAPFGSSGRLFGTNPFAFAAPGRTRPGVLFDAASSLAASGKLSRARRRGVPLEPGWVIDALGQPIINPAEADAGALLPFGGHKGSAIALLVHLLTGILAGSTIGGELTHENPDASLRGQSSFFLAIDPAAFGSREVFGTLVDRQIEAIHASPPLPGVAQVLVPGERGWKQAAGGGDIHIADEDWSVILDALRASGLAVDDLARHSGGTAASLDGRNAVT